MNELRFESESSFQSHWPLWTLLSIAAAELIAAIAAIAWLAN
jgi:hypothetical protein